MKLNVPFTNIVLAFFVVLSAIVPNIASGFRIIGDGHEDITADALRSNKLIRSFSGRNYQFTDSAIEEVADANEDLDQDCFTHGLTQTLYGSKNPCADHVHFDNENFSHSSKRLVNFKKIIIDKLAKSIPDGGEARRLLGQALHTVQDFYSHSNWVELHSNQTPSKSNINTDLGRYTFDTVISPGTKQELDASVMCNITKQLVATTNTGAKHSVPRTAPARPPGVYYTAGTTGYYPEEGDVCSIPSDLYGIKCLHGPAIAKSCVGINKDAPSGYLGSQGFTTARKFAVLASEDYVKQILDGIANDSRISNKEDAIKEFMGLQNGGAIVSYEGTANGRQVKGKVYLNKEYPPAVLWYGVDQVPHLTLSFSGRTVDGSVIDSESPGDGTAGISLDFNIPYYSGPGRYTLDGTFAQYRSTLGITITGGDANLIARAKYNSHKVYEVTPVTTPGTVPPITGGPYTGWIQINTDGTGDFRFAGHSWHKRCPPNTPLLVTPSCYDDESMTFTGPFKVTLPIDAPGQTVTAQASSLKTAAAAASTTAPLYFDSFYFVEYKGRGGHEALHPINGQPALGNALVMAALSEPVTTARFSLIDSNDQALSMLTMTKGDPRTDSDNYVGTITNLPAAQFRAMVTGTDISGNAFSLIHPQVFNARLVSIRPSNGAQPVVIEPGTRTTFKFDVQNHGTTGTFDIVASDTGGFASAAAPQITLNSGQKKTIDIHVDVPATTAISTLDRISVQVNRSNDISDSNSISFNRRVNMAPAIAQQDWKSIIKPAGLPFLVPLLLSDDDTAAPILTVPVNTTANITTTNDKICFGAATATDNKDASPKIEYSINGTSNWKLSNPSGNCSTQFSQGANTVYWRATDAAGNVTTLAQQTVTVTIQAGIISKPCTINLDYPGTRNLSGTFIMHDTTGAVFGTVDDSVTGIINTTAVCANESCTTSAGGLDTSQLFHGAYWNVAPIRLFDAGSWTFEACLNDGSTNCTQPVPLNMTVNQGQLGAHMLFSWGALSQNIDVVTVWDVDCANHQLITTDPDLDGIPGTPTVDGNFKGFSIAFDLDATGYNLHGNSVPLIADGGYAVNVPATKNKVDGDPPLPLTHTVLTANQLPLDSAASYCLLGGCLDFTTSSGPIVSDASGSYLYAQVVLPLSGPIPSNSKYRILYPVNGSWVSFSLDSRNNVKSAPRDAATGYCPEPGAVNYRAASATDILHPGDECIQLTIEDNGPYDYDTRLGLLTVIGGVSSNVNIAPTAVDSTATTSTDVPVMITVVPNLAQDTDGTVDPASIIFVAPPAHGTVSTAGDGTVTYTPNSGFVGVDTFVYRVADNMGALSNAATVTITVTLPPINWTVAGQLESGNGGPWGGWTQEDMCGHDEYMAGFIYREEEWQGFGSDNTAGNSVAIRCSKPHNPSLVTLHPPIHPGYWGVWSNDVYCPSLNTYDNYVNGFRLWTYPPQGTGNDDWSVSWISFHCEDGTELSPQFGQSITLPIDLGNLGPLKTCPAGQAACGISLKIEGAQGGGDDTALNDVKLRCCTR